MWRLLCASLAVLLIGSVQLEAGPSKINWLTSYENALTRGKQEKKPILIFFTGSDWCGWCQKLDKEVLTTQEFYQVAGDQFVFLLVDFPLKSSLDSTVVAQNRELQKKFDVKGFPTLVIIDDEQQTIGVTGYRQGGPASYAEHLLKMVQDFKKYKKDLSLLTQNPRDAKALEPLYEKARALGCKEDAEKILLLGLKAPDNRFFLLERFRQLADKGLIHSTEAHITRQELLAKDPANELKTHYEVAVIEFEAFAEEMENGNYAAEIAVAPLIAYIERFGPKDEANLWKLHMIVAQVYLDKNKKEEAVRHAKASLNSAPTAAQDDIRRFISKVEIETQKGFLT